MTVKGLAQLEQAFRQKADQVEAALTGAVAAEAHDIRDDERRSVPVVTGATRAGIEARVDGLKAEVGIWNPDLYHAVFIEWGRKNAPAQPFATPAAELARTRWPSRAEAAVRQAIR